MNEYYIAWREDYEDFTGWFTKVDAAILVNRIWALEANGDSGEPTVYDIIKGHDATREFDSDAN